ncbi:methicillin resistance protein FmtA, partial [Staphylococcus epidermidis]
MKKRIEIITLTIVLIILITLFIIFLMKVYKTNHKDTEYNKVNDNKTYLQKRDYRVSKVD